MCHAGELTLSGWVLLSLGLDRLSPLVLGAQQTVLGPMLAAVSIEGYKSLLTQFSRNSIRKSISINAN